MNTGVQRSTRRERIHDRISAALPVIWLDVIDESYMHAVPRGAESHFRIVVVSPEFVGMPPIARHRVINALLADELAAGLHALAIEARTPAQWEAAGGPTLTSPACHGGSRHERNG